MDTVTFVIVLSLTGNQFIGTREYMNYEQCMSDAILLTLNTTYERKCIPNLKRVPDETHDERVNPFTEEPEK